MNIFEWISKSLIVLLVGICSYLTKMVIQIPEKYVQKTECQHDSDRIYNDNKEAHKEIFRKFDEQRDILDDLKNMIMEIKK